MPYNNMNLFEDGLLMPNHIITQIMKKDLLSVKFYPKRILLFILRVVALLFRTFLPITHRRAFECPINHLVVARKK